MCFDGNWQRIKSQSRLASGPEINVCYGKIDNLISWKIKKINKRF